MKHNEDLYIHAKFQNYGPSVFDELQAGYAKHLRPATKEGGGARAAAAAARNVKELVSDAAQSKYRDSESQALRWDTADNPSRHPDHFYQGSGLHYPVLYDPAWPVHIAHRRTKAKSNPSNLKPKTIVTAAKVDSWAVTGMTLGQSEGRPIKQTLCFPHRNVDLPFRQPCSIDMQDLVFEPCEKLSLSEIDKIQRRIILKSILERLENYDKTNSEARMKAFQILLNLASRPQDQSPPFIKKRGKPKWRLAVEANKKANEKKKDIEDIKMVPQIIFVDDGAKCLIHGFSGNPNLTQKYICTIHHIDQIKEEDIVSKDANKAITNEEVVDDNWCCICNGSNLHRKVYGEDCSKYPPAPYRVKKSISNNKEDLVEKKEVKKGPRIWCSICKGFDLHRKVYEWPLLEKEIEYESDSEDGEWCPMCKGFDVHRKLFGEDYNDYPNPPYKPKRDKNDKGVYCPYCKGFNVHRIVYDWPIL